MAKYKPGDRVRVREDLEFNKWYKMEGGNSIPPTKFMVNFLRGKELTVESVGEYYRMEETGSLCAFADEMLEDALPEVDIRIYRKGRKTIAFNAITGEKGFARCHPDDEFNPDYGAWLAMVRLLDLPSVPGRLMAKELELAVDHIKDVYLLIEKGNERWK